MNVITAIRSYISKILNEVKGVKVLLLDEETKYIMSVAYSLSEILKDGAYLIDYINNPKRENIKDVKCVCIIRPSMKNISLLKEELLKPKYPEYHLCNF